LSMSVIESTSASTQSTSTASVSSTTTFYELVQKEQDPCQRSTRKVVKRKVWHATALTSSPYKVELQSARVKQSRPVKRALVEPDKSGNDGRKPKSQKQTCRQDRGNRPPALPTPPRMKKKKGTCVRCSGCKVAENSSDDRALGQDWVKCVCGLWWHEDCGEKGGIFDDEYFTCPLCIAKQ